MSAFSAPARPTVDVAVLQGEIEAVFGFRCSVPSFVAGGQDTDASVLRATTTEGQEVAVKVSRRAGRPGGLLVSDHLAEPGIYQRQLVYPSAHVLTGVYSVRVHTMTAPAARPSWLGIALDALRRLDLRSKPRWRRWSVWDPEVNEVTMAWADAYHY